MPQSSVTLLYIALGLATSNIVHHHVSKRVSGGGAPVLVVFAGLEGTGHHLICQSLAPRVRNSSCYFPQTVVRNSSCYVFDGTLQTLMKSLIFERLL